MTQEFVPYELAVKLKALGFDEPCFGRWLIITEWEKPTGEVRLQIGSKVEDYSKNQCAAPLYQQAFRWFREKYELHSTITSISQESWQWHITKPSESLGKLYGEDFYTYEETELACLEKLLEIVETKSE